MSLHFQQQAFNAAAVIHHMKKLQLSQSEPSSSPLPMPDILVQSSSQNDLHALGPSHDETDDLDPNGNPVHASSYLLHSDPDSGRGVCPPLRTIHSEPGNTLTADETRDDSQSHTGKDTPFRPSKRWDHANKTVKTVTQYCNYNNNGSLYYNKENLEIKVLGHEITFTVNWG